MNLTTLEMVRDRLDQAGDRKKDDPILMRIIARVSSEAEKAMARDVTSEPYVHTLDMASGQCSFQLRAWPVSSVAYVRYDNSTDRAFESTTELASTAYLVDKAAGLVRIFTPRVGGPQVLRVSYSGGMAADVDDFVEAYPDIADALAEQVVHVFGRRKGPGDLARTIGGASVTLANPQQWLTPVAAVLADHRTGDLL